MLERFRQKFDTILNSILPHYGSDAYYGYASNRDDHGDEPDHLDINTTEGREAWNKWLKSYGYPILPPLSNTQNTQKSDS